MFRLQNFAGAMLSSTFYTCFCLRLYIGATGNARPENAGLENDGQNFSKLWAKLRGLENAGLEYSLTDRVN